MEWPWDKGPNTVDDVLQVASEGLRELVSGPAPPEVGGKEGLHSMDGAHRHAPTCHRLLPQADLLRNTVSLLPTAGQDFKRIAPILPTAGKRHRRVFRVSAVGLQAGCCDAVEAESCAPGHCDQGLDAMVNCAASLAVHGCIG
eukprot:5195149-Amphidinium_carterae.1